MVKRKISTILLSIVLALFLLSASLACTILIRDIYYLQIDSLRLPETTGYSEETIREAYDEMMDYCTGGGEAAGRVFGTGELIWSEDGKAHFDDVERLFHLDFVILGISGGILLLFLVARIISDSLRKKQKAAGTGEGKGSSIPEKDSFLYPWRFLNRGPLFWGPVGLAALSVIVVIIAAINFDAFFTTFHTIFFPGKDNWIFYPDQDAIIQILPEKVFENFAIVAVGFLLLGCLICIAADFILSSGKKRSKKTSE